MRAPTLALSFAVLVASAFASTAAAQVRQPAPAIERIEPASGPVGTTVELVGRHFRPDQSVRLGTLDLEVVSRLPTRWTLRVPPGATTARVVIGVAGLPPVEGPEFRVLAAAPPPVVTDIAPRGAAPGAEVRLLGSNFSPRPTEDVVTLAGAPVVVRHATPTELVVVVPQGASSGRFAVRVAGAGEASAPVDLTIAEGFGITGFTPAIAPPGGRVELRGARFAARANQNRVWLGDHPCRVIAATPNTLTVELPANAASGLFRVEVPGEGRALSASPLTVQPMPTIAALEPAAGPPGATFRVRGANFGSDVRLVAVTIGGIAATVRDLREARELVVEVPSTAAAGPVEVTVNGLGPARSSSPFTVLVPLSVTGFAPRSGGPGTEVTLSGQGFSTTLTDDHVTLSGVPCEVVAATPTQLRVRVPQATSGPLLVDVTNAGGGRTSQPFVVTRPPSVAGFEPAMGEVGSTLVIRGAAFGTNAGLVEAYLGEQRLEVQSVTEQEIRALVPAGGTDGRVRVTVRLQGTSTSEAEFHVVGPFSIAAVEPTSTFPGQPIVVRGVGFGARATLRVTGVEDAVPFTRTGPTELRAILPDRAATGPVTVRSEDGREVSIALEVTPPPAGVAITSIEPACPRTGCALVLRGHGFAPRASGQTLTIGTTRVRIRRAGPYALEANLPATAGTMTIRLDVRGRGRVETAPITVEPGTP